MIKDANNFPVLYWIGGSAAICPKCGNGNAMLDGGSHIPGGRYLAHFECRDCGFKVSVNKQTSVDIGMDVDNREYTGVAADGTEVTLGCFDNPFEQMMNFLKDHPTPDTW